MKNNRQYRKQLKLQLLGTLWWQPLRKKMTPFRQLIVKMLVELFIESKIETSRNWPAERFMVEALNSWIHECTPLRPENDLGLLMFGFELRMAALGHVPGEWWEQYVIAETDLRSNRSSSESRALWTAGTAINSVVSEKFELQQTSPAWEHLHEMDVHNGNMNRMYPEVFEEVIENPDLKLPDRSFGDLTDSQYRQIEKGLPLTPNVRPQPNSAYCKLLDGILSDESPVPARPRMPFGESRALTTIRVAMSPGLGDSEPKTDSTKSD